MTAASARSGMRSATAIRGTQMNLSEGWIYQADIVGIKKGGSGDPGELSGVIDYGEAHRLGSITGKHAARHQGETAGNFGSAAEGGIL